MIHEAREVPRKRKQPSAAMTLDEKIEAPLSELEERPMPKRRKDDDYHLFWGSSYPLFFVVRRMTISIIGARNICLGEL